MTADRSQRVRASLTGVLTVLLAAAAVLLAPSANAMAFGNYALNIQNRFDFHTWIWFIAPCTPKAPDCLQVRSRHQPIARAYPYDGEARLVNGQWTLAVDDPFGLRCGNVYYGPVVPTHDVYTWDPNTFAGSMVSTFAAGCDGQPGTLTYPFALART